ncbi:class I SAM-dependent methyltransferase [Spirillospora sp. CA-255316]
MTEGSPAQQTAEQFWEEFYGKSDRIWSGRPNPLLVREVSDLPPGTALDLGCGEGADAIWLAGRGWRVTAVDISAVALERAAGHAAEAGVAGAIDWQRRDLAGSFPPGAFDLVCAHFLHSPVELPQERIMRSAAAAVAPGGVLLVVGHAGFPAPERHRDHEVRFPTLTEMIDSFDLEEGRWEVEVSESVTSEWSRPGGEHGTRTDNVVRIRRSKD